jgi:hypothetical protein
MKRLFAILLCLATFGITSQVQARYWRGGYWGGPYYGYGYGYPAPYYGYGYGYGPYGYSKAGAITAGVGGLLGGIGSIVAASRD